MRLIIDMFRNDWNDVTSVDDLFDSPEPQTDGNKLTNKTFPSPYEVMSKYPTPLKRYSKEANECAVRVSIALLDNKVDISGSKRFRKLIQINDGRLAQA